MFRESDYKEQAFHSSYTRKPISQLQLSSQAASFDDTRRKPIPGAAAPSALPEQDDPNTYLQRLAATKPVPTTFDTIYDPSHPKADWSGCVSLKDWSERKHTNSHRSQQVGISQTEYGIVSNTESNEFSRLRKKDDVKYNPVTGAPISSTSDLIGGISQSEKERFKTNYQSLALGESTSMSQLTSLKRDMLKSTMGGRSNHNSNGHYPGTGSRQTSPRLSDNPFEASTRNYLTNYDNSQIITPRSQDENSMFNNSINGQESLAGYRAPRVRSLLSNIGSSVFEANPSVVEEFKKVFPQESSKAEKAKAALPGYTGYRPRREDKY